MPRIRSIKPEFPQSESMGRVSRDARLLFVLLWTIVDDAGRTRAHSRALASLLYPYDDDAKDHIDDWLAELVREDCIRLYLVDGAHYLQVCKWQDHQKIDRPSKSKFPDSREASRGLDAPSRALVDGSGSGSGSKDQRKGEDQGAPAPVARAPLSPTETSPVGTLFDHWRAVAASTGVIEPAIASPKFHHQAKALLAVHPPVVLQLAMEAFWETPHFDGKRHFGMFASNAGQLVAHVQAGHRHRFGERNGSHAPAIGSVAAGACAHHHDPPCHTAQACTRRWLDEERTRQGIGPRQPTSLSVSA